MLKIKKRVFTITKGAAQAKTSSSICHTAFTLAEVLITLGVIGIVAAMTLPTVINNSRNKQLETRLKRSYSVIAQALDQYQAETGERITPQNSERHTLKAKLAKYLNVIRDCGYGAEENYEKLCYSRNSGTDKDGIYKTFNNKQLFHPYFDDGQFVLNDGSLILIENAGDVNLFISVDVNGFNKKPNRLGHDLFMFQINEKGTLLPMGVNGTAYYNERNAYCSISLSSYLSGIGCTYNALTDKDYFKNLPK